VLLTLLHWQRPSRASWVPLLDTKLLPRLSSGRKHETYFPVAVADDRFHCIILKGGDQYPYFPRPLLSEFEFSIPLTAAPPKAKAADGEDGEDGGRRESSPAAEEEEESELRKLEQTFLLKGIQASQMRDAVEAIVDSDSVVSTRSQRVALARLELDIDKALLQLLAIECRAGEERGPRALEAVQLLRDRTGRMIEAAGKVAERYGQTILGEKIREIGEERIASGHGGRDDDFE
jgi:chromosome transmission fidelity protein 4